LSVAEFINRANCKLIIGNFELDFELREFRYKTSFDLFDLSVAIPTFGIINNVVYTNISTMDEFPAGLTSIIDSDIIGKYAIDQIEYIPNYTELCSLIDEGITVRDFIEIL
jgi:hypothetical protein